MTETIMNIYENFSTALNRYDKENLSLPDEELKYIILEELDIEAISFLHSKTINILINNNLIPKTTAEQIETLRSQTLYLINNKRSIQEIRDDKEWLEVRELALLIKSKIIDSKIN